MGSWTELDAYYPPDALSPAAAYLVAFAHLYGLDAISSGDGHVHPRLARRSHGIVPTADVLARATHWLAQPDAFLAQVGRTLNPQQRRCLALNLLDAALDEELPLPAGLLEALGCDLGAFREALALLDAKNDRSIFPQ